MLSKIALVGTLLLALFPGALAAESAGSFYQLGATSIEGARVGFDAYRGKVLMVVNTASKCGFTAQYADLQKLYLAYKDKGFEVLGFPSDDFTEEELESNGEIKKFCRVRYGVSFPMFSLGHVKGDQQQAVFKFLTSAGAEDQQGAVEWNFEKFLIDRSGKVRMRYGPFTNPTSTRIKEEVEKLLAEK